MKAIVVGAGVVGMVCALRLAERGATVEVLDAEAEGAWPTRSASRAAAGMLGPLSETMMEHHHVHPLLVELGLTSLDLWRERGDSLGLSTFPPRGARLVGYPLEQLEALVNFAKAMGRRTEERGEMVILPEEGALDPAEALRALARALADSGGSLRRRAHVIEAHSGGVTLADGARLAADIAVLAPGAWGANLAAPLAQLEPMKGQLAEVESNALAPGETLRGPGVYAVGRAPGRVVIGATMEPGRVDLGTDVEAIADMMERAEALSHALHNVKLVRSWAGVRPMNPDWAPRVTRTEGLILAYGHSRNGWLLAPVTAEIVAALAFGDEIKPLWAEFGA